MSANILQTMICGLAPYKSAVLTLMKVASYCLLPPHMLLDLQIFQVTGVVLQSWVSTIQLAWRRLAF